MAQMSSRTEGVKSDHADKNNAMRTPTRFFLPLLVLISSACSDEPTPEPRAPTPKSTTVENSKSDSAQLLAYAREGKLDAILLATGHNEPDGFYDNGPEAEGDPEAYKWLLIARDFGHAEADKVLDDLRSISSLRYDDGNLVTGIIEYQLGLAYLRGSEGLAIDFAKADLHLRSGVNGARNTDVDFELDRVTLTGRAREVFDLAISARAKKRERITITKHQH